MRTFDISGNRLTHGEHPFRIVDIESLGCNWPKLSITGDAILLCTSGTARISIFTEHHDLDAGSEVILIGKDTLFIISASEDFRVKVLLYSYEIATQATFKFPSTFFNHILQSPVFHHREGDDTVIRGYMDMLRQLQADTRNRYQVLMATNLIRNIMLNAYDKMQRQTDWRNHTAASRKEELYGRFMDLVIKHARKHRDVNYYADRLCITPKYLSDVTKSVAGETPKQTIDNFLLTEIKLMLAYSDMTMQQIAYALHFPSHSNFGRYFKQRTGMSPGAYRETEGQATSSPSI